MSSSRRQVLALLATVAGVLAGCPEASSTTQTSPDGAGGTRTKPVEVETPTSGGCQVTSLPMPDSVPEEFQDDLSIMSYPDKPAMEEESVVEFLREFEHDYQTNRLIEEGPSYAPEDVDEDPRVDAIHEVVVRIRPVRDGFVAFTAIGLLATYEQITESPVESPTPTPNPISSAQGTKTAAYYVTDRFLMRQSPRPDTDSPMITGGEVVQCW